MSNCLKENISESNENCDIKIREILLKIGIFSHLQGYRYILEAVKILKAQKIHTRLTTVYSIIDKKLNAKSVFEIERGIKYCINKSYKNGEILNKIYSKIPSNSKFLYDLVFNTDIIEKNIKKIEKNC